MIIVAQLGKYIEVFYVVIVSNVCEMWVGYVNFFVLVDIWCFLYVM